MSKGNPGNVRESLARVQSILDEGRPDRAAEYLLRIGMESAELRNAYGVCLMRAGKLEKAVEAYQTLCLNGSVCLKANVPTVHIANYATALLLTGNLAGCRAALRQVREPAHPAGVRLDKAIERWQQSLTWVQRMRLYLGGAVPEKPIDLGGAPGVGVIDDRVNGDAA